MATGITNLGLLNKCKRFILTDPTVEAEDELIQDALITANRELYDIDSMPLAWMRETYNELFCRYYAEISAITAAGPGVITCDSLDPDIGTAHGFETDDIVYIDGLGDVERLNHRLFRAIDASDTTITLEQLDGQNAIDTTNYEAYVSGGYIYHAGILIPHTTIEPTSSWTIRRIFAVSFDMNPADPLSEESAKADKSTWFEQKGRPRGWRHLKYSYGTPDSIEHFLLFNPPASSRKYNIEIGIEKEYPDLSTWTDAVYPPHPNEVHDAIWHRALANLAYNAERQKRQTDQRVNTRIEIRHAENWKLKSLEDENRIKNLSRNLLGFSPHSRGFSA